MIPNEAALRQAMERLLAGNPTHHRGPVRKADGSLHILGWATEAGVGATVPYRFKGLIAEFQRELDRTDSRPADRYEARLVRIGDELAAERDRARRYRAQRDAARAEAARLASVVALLDREVEIARAERPDVVRPLRRPAMKEI
ncbi:MAG TPA: hypothetical protein VGR90_01710 [Acidimicrobiales bacterium]|nr:hypothetical protein [Acidimicrobiales bacterium]